MGESPQTSEEAIQAHLERLASVGALAASAAHEVNNLLTPALAYAQLAQGSGDVELMRKAVDRAQAGIEAASRVMSGILEFSQPEGGAGDASIAAALAAAIDCLPRAPERDAVEIQTSLDETGRIAMTPLSLQQVLLNLLLNATRAMRPCGGGTIRITVSREDDDVRLEVADNGPGIPKDMRDRVFEPFVSGRDAEADQSDGAGLGLAVCRRMIEQAGGTIAVSETPGGGATFTIQAPASADSRSVVPLPKAG